MRKVVDCLRREMDLRRITRVVLCPDAGDNLNVLAYMKISSVFT